MATSKQLDTIARHFMIAAVWADAPEGTRPRITKKALETARRCAVDFVDSIGERVFYATLAAYTEAGLHPDCNDDPCAAFGHDLYLTLAGHGVGFWDRRELRVPLNADAGCFLGDWLTARCHQSNWRNMVAYGGLEFYRGWVHFRSPYND